MQAHADIVVENSEVELHTKNTIEASHQDDHHKNDSEEQRNTEHHHHCSVISISDIFIKEEIQLDFLDVYFIKSRINFYKKLHTSGFLDKLFHPPRLA